MQDIGIEFLCLIFTKATSSPVHFLPLSESDPNWESEGWPSLSLEFETPTFSYHLIILPCENSAKPLYV